MIVLGPGLGTGEDAKKIITYVLENSDKSIVLDGDGITMCSREQLKKTKAPWILTPHPKEFCTISGWTMAELKEEFLQKVKQFAEEQGGIVVGKDARTCVSDGNECYVNISGNSGMATGGSGDVLAGTIGGLVAQGMSCFEAAKAAVYLHGLAGDRYKEKYGEHGMMARDLIDSCRKSTRMENEMDELLEKKKYDRTYVEIDLEAIKHNIRCEREKVGDKVKIMAIIKANAYGHGDIEVAEALKDEVDAYGVAIIEEALKLRKAGVTKMILILGHTGKIWYDDLIKNDISQAVYSYEMAKILSEEAMRLGKKAKIHIKVDTGMGRIGFQPVKDNVEVIYAISRLPGIEIEGIFTHFARADEVSTEWTKEPFEKFQIFRHELQKRGVEIPLAHVANSASILRLPSTYLDMVRSGITTYGLFPSDEVKKNVPLRPALSWKTEVVHVKTVHAGTSISYGGTFTAERESVIATIPVGYADGVKRDLSGKGRVLVRGCYAPIVGRICMDQFMIDVTDIPEVKVGDTVTLIGQDGSRRISVEEVAALAHSFNYEYICSITERVPRRYI